jgi:hypothetical protein
MKTRGWIGLALAMTLVGCATKESARSEPVPNAPRAADMQGTDDWCPVHAPGTTVTTVDVEGGVALDFTTTSDVTDLRRRVRSTAERGNHFPGHGTRMDFGESRGDGPNHDRSDHRMGGDGMMGHGSMMSDGLSAAGSVEDLEGGARLTFRPVGPAQLEALRERARTWAVQMSRGECLTMWSDAQGRAAPESDESPR